MPPFTSVMRSATGEVAGLTGLNMLVRMDLWDRFTSRSYWWMYAMVLVWLIFATMLFVVEPNRNPKTAP
jgi:hypothetical protein